MAETTVKQHFIKFSGTKQQFIDKGYPATYQDKIVFIGNGECIYTRGMYFANFNELITAYVAGMNFLKGVTVDGTSYNAAAGGGYVAFEATDPTTVGVNVNQGKITIGLTTTFLNNITNLGTEITNIKRDYATTSAMNTAIGNAKTELKGGTNDTDTSATIAGAKKYADKVTEALALRLVGEGSNSEDNSIAGAKAYADKVSGEVLEDAKEYAEGKASTAETNAKGYADTKKSEVIGTANDASSVDTIKGVRKYVEEKTANIASDSRVQGVEDRVKAIEDDYLVEADKTALGNRITNEAPVTIAEAAGSGDVLKSYTFTQNGKTIGTINLAKELVVTGGEIVEIDGVKNLQLTIANQTTPVNIPVTDLVDVYTAKANATQVQVAISNTNEISASVVAKSITATELNDNAVETAKIKDGNVTKAKLESGVQTSLGKADSAYQKASTGIPKTDLASGVQTSLGKADTAVQKVETGGANGTIKVDGTDVAVKGLGSAAYTASTAYATSAQGTKADSALQSVEGSTYVEVTAKSSNKQTISVKIVDLEDVNAPNEGLADAYAVMHTISEYSTNTLNNAKSYADSQWEWLDLD